MRAASTALAASPATMRLAVVRIFIHQLNSFSFVFDFDLDHAGVTEIDATRMARVGDQRAAAGLHPGAPQRFAGIDGAPGRGVVVTGEEAAAAQPDEERATRI